MRDKEVYYHKDKHECDFIIKKANKIIQAIQVTKELDEDNKKREVNGLIEAMENFKLEQGLILTQNQEQKIKKQGKLIILKPLWKWLLEETK